MTTANATTVNMLHRLPDVLSNRFVGYRWRRN